MTAAMKEQPAQTAQEAQQSIADAVALARQSDVAVVVLGEIDLMSGEYASRSSLKLSNGQEELLEAVSATGKPVVLVLVNGRPLDISWAAEHVPAILEAWYPGSQGGNGIADVLFGDANPSGHLPVSWPRSTGQLPLYYNHNLTQNPETSARFQVALLGYSQHAALSLRLWPELHDVLVRQSEGNSNRANWRHDRGFSRRDQYRQPHRRCRRPALHSPARGQRLPPGSAVEGIRTSYVAAGRETHRALHAREKKSCNSGVPPERNGLSNLSSSTCG